VYTFGEDGFGDCRNGDHCGGVCKAGGISIWAEDSDFVIRGAKGFHPFVGLLPVVEGGSHAMEAEERVCYEFGFGPHAGLDAVVGFDVAIDCWKLARAKYIEVMGSGGVVCLPSRTRKPMSLQSMVFTGGGGNAIFAWAVCEGCEKSK